MRIARALRYGTVKLNVLWTRADPHYYIDNGNSKSRWPTYTQHLTIILINNSVLLLVLTLLLLFAQLFINIVMSIFNSYNVPDFRLLWPLSDVHFGTYWSTHNIPCSSSLSLCLIVSTSSQEYFKFMELMVVRVIYLLTSKPPHWQNKVLCSVKNWHTD